MFTLIFVLVPILMLFAILWWIVTSQKQASHVAVSFPPRSTWFGLLLIVGFQIGVYGTLTTQSFPTVGLLVFGLSSAFAWLVLQWQRRSPLFFLVLAVIVLSSCLMPLRASGFVQVMNVLMLLGANSLLFVRLIRGAFPNSLSRLLADIVSVKVRTVSQVAAVAHWANSQRQSERQGGVLSWLKTLAIAGFGAIVFLFLLSQADLVFAHVVEQLRDQLTGRLLWTLFLGFVITIALSFKQTSENVALKLQWFGKRDLIVLLGTIAVVIAGFLVVQWQYVFGSSRELLSQLDLSYSEYVRRGFIELLLAAAIGGVVSYGAALKLRASNLTSGKSKALLVVNAFLIFELLLLLVSAYKRNVLYVDVYGLTRVRIIGEVFLVWLASGLVVLFVISAWRRLKERWAMVVMGLITVVAWLGLQMVNVDAMIARGAPEHQEYKDYFYIMQLSEDAAREQLELLPDVIAETHQLLQEPTLNENQQAQLAGLKLALLSFAEHRDKLYFHYENEATLLSRWNFLGERWPESFSCDGVNDWRPDHRQPCSATNRSLSDQIKKERGWQFYSPTKQATYDQIVKSDQLENLAFSVEDRITEIEQYQVDHQIDLFKQERRLLYDFSYPFIFVRLRTYSPEMLSSLNTRYYEATVPTDVSTMLQQGSLDDASMKQVLDQKIVLPTTTSQKTLVMPTPVPKIKNLKLETAVPAQ